LVKSIPHQKNKGLSCSFGQTRATNSLQDSLLRTSAYPADVAVAVAPTAPVSRTPPASHRATAAAKAVRAPASNVLTPVGTAPHLWPHGPTSAPQDHPGPPKPHAPPTSGPEPRAPPITAARRWYPMVGRHAIAEAPRATARSEKPVKQVPSGARGTSGVMRNRTSSPGSRRARRGERDELARPFHFGAGIQTQDLPRFSPELHP